jgi:hypothetical protein
MRAAPPRGKANEGRRQATGIEQDRNSGWSRDARGAWSRNLCFAGRDDHRGRASTRGACGRRRPVRSGLDRQVADGLDPCARGAAQLDDRVVVRVCTIVPRPMRPDAGAREPLFHPVVLFHEKSFNNSCHGKTRRLSFRKFTESPSVSMRSPCCFIASVPAPSRPKERRFAAVAG